MSESTQLSEISGPGPNIAQVDPPHPFRSILKALVIAAVVMSIALGVYVYLGQKPPVAAGEILSTSVYPIHTLVNNGGGRSDAGMAGSNEYSDELIILANVRIRNQTNIPLFLQDILSSIKLEDGTEQENITASNRDLDRLFQAYPALDYLKSDSIPRDITLSPGQSTEGLTVFHFPLSKEQWDKLQSAKVVVAFLHQKNLDLPITPSAAKTIDK